MESDRHPKRRRITNHANHVQPDTVASSSDSYAPCVSVVSDPPVSADEFSPSAKDVSTELRNIEGSSSHVNSIRALKKIQKWLMTEQIESSALVLENFHSYGGIARVLDFMEANMNDWDCIVGVAATIAGFLSFRWNEIEKNRKTSIELAKMVVRRKGIQLFLRANREHAIMQKISSDTRHVWAVLGRTINGQETRDLIEKEQMICILKDATDCIRRLEEIGTCLDKSNTWTSDVLQVVLYTIANIIKDAVIGKDVLERTGIVALCLRTINTNDGWNRSDIVVTYALGILTICAKQKNIITKKELNELLPRLIYYMNNFSSDLQIRSFVLILLEITCQKLRKERIESSGVLEVISVLLKSERKCAKTKEKVRDIMRMIIN